MNEQKKYMISLKEFFMEDGQGPDDEAEFSREDKKVLMDSINRLTDLADVIRRSDDFKVATQEVAAIVDAAQNLTKQETADFFDDTTVKRHLKYLENAEKTFKKAAEEIVQNQLRLEAAYEDIIDILRKYYKVGV